MRPFSFLVTFFSVVSACCIFVTPVSAATSTVCGEISCDYHTLTDAFAGVTAPGNVIAVGASYDPAADTGMFPVTVLYPGVTVDCEQSGAVIGQTAVLGDNLVYMSANSAIRNCTLGNVSLRSDSSSPSGIHILNNVFSTTVTSTIIFEQGPVNTFLIDGNTNINALIIRDTVNSNAGIIRNNTFYLRNISGEASVFELKSAGNTGLQIVNNTFESHVTTDVSVMLIFVAGNDTTFATNTVKYLTSPSETMNTSVEIHGAGSMFVSGNIIHAPPSTVGGCGAVRLILTGDALVTWNVNHNSLKIPATCGDSMDGGMGLAIGDNNQAGGGCRRKCLL